MRKNKFNIAIDGPAGAGKSTIAKAVAQRLGFIYVDTGAMYRAMALYFMRKGLGPEDEAGICAACASVDIAIRYQESPNLKPESGTEGSQPGAAGSAADSSPRNPQRRPGNALSQQVILNGEDVTGLIRTEAVGQMASAVSGYPAVRQHLLGLQRSLAASTDVVMDGRDIGTCILPDADAKVFLTASPRVRALRRYKQLSAKGTMCNLEEIEHDIIERDERDSSRAIAPLSQAPDAVLVDSSDMAVDEVIAAIIRIAEARGCPVTGAGESGGA